MHKRNDLPVGLVGLIDNLLLGRVALRDGQLLGIPGYVVQSLDLPAHEDGLCQGDQPDIDVVYVELEGLLGNECHRLGDRLPVVQYGLARHGVGHHIIFILLGSQVEGLGGQILVLFEQRDGLLVVHISTGKVYPREIGSPGRLLGIAGAFDLLLGDAQLLVVLQSHAPTRIERYRLLGRDGRKREQREGYQHSASPYVSVYSHIFLPFTRCRVNTCLAYSCLNNFIS